MITGKTNVFPKYPTEILATRNFKNKFFECLQLHPISLRIASPFIGQLPSFKTVIRFTQFFLREENKSFQLITCPPIDNENEKYISKRYAEVMVKLGVDLLIREKPTLHSKVYQFVYDRNIKISFVGSANFTKGGFERNDETVSMFRDPIINKKVSEELNRLSGFGSLSYYAWKLRKKI